MANKKKFAVYGVATASKFLGYFEAENEQQAKEMASESDEYYISLCHHCSRGLDIGDFYEEQAEEAG